MTTLTHSPSLSPQPFSVPQSRSPKPNSSYRSTTSSGASSPFSRRKPSPLPSTRRDTSQSIRDHYVLNSARDKSGSLSAVAGTVSGQVTSASAEKEKDSGKGTDSVQDTSSKTRDTGTQYTPPEYPPTASGLFNKNLETRLDQASLEDTTSRIDSDPSEMEKQDVTMKDVSPLEQPQAPIPQPQSASQVPKSQETTSATTSNPLPTATSALNNSSSSLSISSLVQHIPSSPKKQRSAASQRPKSLPKDYMRCPPTTLGLIIADMLLELIAINDSVPPVKTLTRFHSRAPPTISVRDYLARLIVHATLSPPLLLATVYYIDRLCAMYPAFTITSLTVHRFLITAATVAAKGLSDSFWTNHTYARVGGVSTHELAMLELDFLGRLDWSIVPKPEVLEDYYRSLVARAEDYILESDSDDDDDDDGGVVEKDGEGGAVGC